METIIKYKTKDNREFSDKTEADNHEILIGKVEQVMKPLGTVPKDVRDGKGWLQHRIEIVNTAKDQILDLCREQGLDKQYSVFSNQGRECHPLSIIGRILSDIGGPISRAWARFGRIDELGREHQQQYYAYTNGPADYHVCIEDRR